MIQEKILERLSECQFTLRDSSKIIIKTENKQISINSTEKPLMQSRITLMQNQTVNSNNNDSVITTKNDPDYFRLSKTKYEINKSYMELIEKTLKASSSRDDVVIKNDKANYQIVKGSFERLKPGNWLNDDIINAYISLINLRTQSLGSKKAYIFNTFFYTMIEDMHGRSDYDFKKLMRIINRKKVNLLDYD